MRLAISTTETLTDLTTDLVVANSNNPGTRSFIYADDICVTSQYSSFTEVEETIEDALEEITQYYRSNSLRANPDKTQVTTFHLRNKQEKISLKVKWSNTELENTDQPKYLGVTLVRTLSYKQHIHTTKMTVATRNNLLWKLANSKRGTSASTIITTVIALCYSIAEYAAPVWARSHHVHVLDSELNTACRAITGCLKPTNVEDLYLLAGIAPPDIRRDGCARVEKKQESNVAHSLYVTLSMVRTQQSCLKSRRCFLVVVDLPLLRVTVEGSDNPISLEKPCQASLPPDQQRHHSLGRHPKVQYAV